MARMRSAKGVIVDFDILRIKQQMQKASPPTATIKAREDFIDKRIRRRVNTLKRQPTIEKTEGEIDVVPTIPGNDEPEATFIQEEAVNVSRDDEVPKIRQKARK